MNDAASDHKQNVDESVTPRFSSTGGPIRRLAAICGAAVCMALAVSGFFLPVLPCTPFVLLASFLLIRGSPTMHAKLRRSKFFGRILADWEDRKGIRQADKIRAIIIVVATLIITLALGPHENWLRLLTVALVAIGLWIIARLPLAKDS